MADPTIDSSQWQSYAKIDPELEAILPSLPPAKSFADYESVTELRNAANEKQAQDIAAGIIKVPDWISLGIEKTEIRIPTRDGSFIRAVRYHPKSNPGGPLFVYFHGGGYVFGGPDMCEYESGFTILTAELGFTILSVDYRKSPEHVFPTAIHDGFDSVRWIGDNASKLGADPSKGFIVGGTSAGGNITAVVSHQVKEAGLSPPITGVFLNVPALVHPEAVPDKYKLHYRSLEQNKDSRILDKRGLEFFIKTYKPDPESPLVSPLNWPSGHSALPPTYFQICGMDPLRDEALIYEHQLRQDHNVPTRVDIYKGLPHVAQYFMPFLKQSEKSLKDLKDGFIWLLGQK